MSIILSGWLEAANILVGSYDILTKLQYRFFSYSRDINTLSFSTYSNFGLYDGTWGKSSF